MIRILVVDDEPFARASLIACLSEQPGVIIAGEASNGIEALERIEELSPDAVFLDVEMPGLDGFGVVENLHKAPLIIFATAFNEYAVKAFEANAVDYILKPLQPHRVKQAVEKLRVAMNRDRTDYDSALREVLQHFRTAPPIKIAARKGKRIVLLPVKDVTHVSITDKIVFIYTALERYLSDRTLNELEKLLTPAGFFRIGRSDLVNLEYVRELLPMFSGTCKVKLSTGAELDVSRERTRQLKEAIGL